MSRITTDLKPHLALVTGASGGIGKATCLALASMGCSVAVHYYSSTEKAERLVNELKKLGVRAERFKADLTNYDEVNILSVYKIAAWNCPAIYPTITFPSMIFTYSYFCPHQ